MYRIEEKIEGRVVINEAQEKEMITDAMKESGIIVNRTDHKKLKYFTVKVEALFACYNCDKPWSSHMGTIVVDLWECKVNRNNCRQRCKECIGSWAWPRLTEDRFKEVMDRVITKYWDRNKQDDDGNGSTLVDGDKHTGNPRAPHEQSLCERCMKLGRACW